MPPPGFSLACHPDPLNEQVAGARQPRHDGPDGDRHHARDFLVAQAFDLPQHQSFAIGERQSGDGPVQLLGVDLGDQHGFGRRRVRTIDHFQTRSFEQSVIVRHDDGLRTVLGEPRERGVTHDGEKPGRGLLFAVAMAA
jgi:hypothetical protein